VDAPTKLTGRGRNHTLAERVTSFHKAIPIGVAIAIGLLVGWATRESTVADAGLAVFLAGVNGYSKAYSP
jgi:hypothetical protein